MTQNEAGQPKRFGPYRILQTLGEGGMGMVYLAEQTEPIRRRVALKVIRPGTMRPEVVQRFEAERQALARMNHPNIAQALEAGATEDGQPYFVMEYVPGMAITRYCDEKRLTVRQRLELFLAVCDGVHHLHQKGIIHRDIKPSNVLVTEDRDRPVPKIIDFGIAKALDRPLTGGTVFTGERLIGTPGYLSPESIQASGVSGDVDTRSDVYALGVVLYELLAGEVPFGTREESFLEVARRITEEEAPLASARVAEADSETRATRASVRRLEATALGRRLEGDLDWITRKAMEKERSQRYGSAAELAEDVRRHLRHEPVVASPPGTVYRLRKFVRRHRSAVASALLVALALVGGFTARTLEAARSGREEERASLEAARASREAEAARQVSEFLVGLFEVSDPEQAAAGGVTARELLDRGAEKLSGKDLEDQPLLQARLMDTIGSVYRKLGFYQPATQLLEGALEIRRRDLGEAHIDVATSLNNLGNLHRDEGDYSRADVALREALEIRERILGPDHLEVAKSLNNLGALHHDQGDLSEAESFLVRALEIKDQALGSNHPSFAKSLANLANVYRSQGKNAEAESALRRTLTIFESAFGPDHSIVAMVLNNLAVTLYDQGRYAESEPAHRRAAAIYEKTLGPEHPELARSLTNLAEIHWKLGRYAESEQVYQRSRMIWEGAVGPEHPDLSHPILGLANLYRDQGRYLEAEPLYRRAVDLREALAPDHPDLLKALEDYAAYLRAVGRADEAALLEARAEAARTENGDP